MHNMFRLPYVTLIADSFTHTPARQVLPAPTPGTFACKMLVQQMAVFFCRGSFSVGNFAWLRRELPPYPSERSRRKPSTTAVMASVRAFFSRLRGSEPAATRPISLLRFVNSKSPGDSPWAWEFHPAKSRLCLSQTL